ncbi:MAG TPA: type I DNA topoisomerase [Burkholderiales bacterium]|nr:type I DNA topoisomerase [Burkholderiales bacterium]
MAKKNGKSLVVVESPAKARTISRILGDQFDVKASVGHIRDLPQWGLGVNTESFEPKYEVPKDKRKVVKEIGDAAKKADRVYLATDPDREGEAIAWHLAEAAGFRPDNMERVVFHEITQDAVREAFAHPRSIDMDLVNAQQARRVVDRLMGYPLSWFLGSKVRKGLSAGRVQSVAVRLVVEREREIRNFQPQEHWTIEAQLEKNGSPPAFRAKYQGVLGKKFDKFAIPDEAESERLVADLRSAEYSVQSVETKSQSRRPAAPFITSTLQQEASRRLGFPAKRTMSIAQKLYEGIDIGEGGEVGLITYMRTDSTNVATSAQDEARRYIAQKYGDQFLPRSPRQYTKKVKGAQEAHEAVRPTSVMRDPESIKQHLTSEQQRLYTLIWQRFIASQMADAEFDVTTAEIHARSASPDPYVLRATNTQLRFAGFRQVYIEGRDEGEEEEDVGTNPLPALVEGDPLTLRELFPEQHFTEPPPRYTEASLVKALEEKGIGRPSTYAPTMSTIQEREYVKREKSSLYPTDLGETVNDLLVEYFPVFIDVNFTAGMEQDLDEVAEGEKEWQPVVRDFYEPLQKALEIAKVEAPKQVEETGELCPEGHPMIIRWGRRGQFQACSAYPEHKYTRPMPGEEPEEELPQIEEACPDCGQPLTARRGRNGPFIGCTGYPKCRYTRPIDGQADELPQIDEACPDCGKPLSVRRSARGPFIGCTGYPGCKYTRPAPTGVKCPRDGGDLEEKRAKGRRAFFGCSNYPECDFTVASRPLPQPCPQCGSLITLERDGGAKCTACEWRGEVPAAVPEPAGVG